MAELKDSEGATAMSIPKRALDNERRPVILQIVQRPPGLRCRWDERAYHVDISPADAAGPSIYEGNKVEDPVEGRLLDQFTLQGLERAVEEWLAEKRWFFEE